jgi:hypothetical protein
MKTEKYEKVFVIVGLNSTKMIPVVLEAGTEIEVISKSDNGHDYLLEIKDGAYKGYYIPVSTKRG